MYAIQVTRRRSLALVCTLASATTLASACGARTAVSADIPSESIDAGTKLRDAAVADAWSDTLPPLAPNRDGSLPNECKALELPAVYLVTSQTKLLKFEPATRTFTELGTLDCASGATRPHSMAVDRRGIAYVLFSDAALWRVDTSTQTCAKTAYVPDQHGFAHFGMAFVADGQRDELFVSDNEHRPTYGLATIDVATLTLRRVAPFDRDMPRCELTGSGDGSLFAFCLDPLGASAVVQVDKRSGSVIRADMLSVGRFNDAFAIALWGGKFYAFTSADGIVEGGTGMSIVTEYDPVSKNETRVAVAPWQIVGAGVSTCAPL